MTEKKILVPNIGDFKNVEVIEVLVKSGEQIKKNDPLITLESDKSSVEVPATDEGKINKIIVKVGDKVSEGSEILSLDSKYDGFLIPKLDTLLLLSDTITGDVS